VPDSFTQALTDMRNERDRLQMEINKLVVAPLDEAELTSEKRGVQRSINILLDAFGVGPDESIDDIDLDDPFLTNDKKPVEGYCACGEKRLHPRVGYVLAYDHIKHTREGCHDADH
jgi:hypothetical protein